MEPWSQFIKVFLIFKISASDCCLANRKGVMSIEWLFRKTCVIPDLLYLMCA